MNTVLSSLLHDNDDDNNDDNNHSQHEIHSSLHSYSCSLRAVFPLWSSTCWKQSDQCGLVDCFCIHEWVWTSLLSLIRTARQIVIQGKGNKENVVDLLKRLLQFIVVMLRVCLSLIEK